MVKLECKKCNHKSIFPDKSTANFYGWCEVGGEWYCYKCDPEPPKDFRPEHLKRMGVAISKGGEE